MGAGRWCLLSVLCPAFVSREAVVVLRTYGGDRCRALCMHVRATFDLRHCGSRRFLVRFLLKHGLSPFWHPARGDFEKPVSTTLRSRLLSTLHLAGDLGSARYRGHGRLYAAEIGGDDATSASRNIVDACHTCRSRMYSDAGAILQILMAAMMGCKGDCLAVTTRESAEVYLRCTNLEAAASMMRGGVTLF